MLLLHRGRAVAEFLPGPTTTVVSQGNIWRDLDLSFEILLNGVGVATIGSSLLVMSVVAASSDATQRSQQR